MEQKINSVPSARTNDDRSTNVEVTTSSPNNAKPNVGGSLTELEKQLIIISNYGIWIEQRDGHRWIMSEPLESWSYHKELAKKGISLNNKIYGGVKEALYVIDETWQIMYAKTLVEYFDDYIDVKWDINNINTNHNRIDIVKSGKGGLF